MEAHEREALVTQKEELRLELKIWEADFATQHGRKVRVEDIQQNAAIRQKHKEYNRISEALKAKHHVPVTKQKRQRPETAAPDSPHTKRRKTPPQHTPQKSKSTQSFTFSTHQQENRVENEQEDFKTPTIKRTFIGPTPQRDGKVLGIFTSPPVAEDRVDKNRAILGELDSNKNAISSTPSAAQGGMVDKIQESPADAAQYEERARGSRTPASSGKRFMLDAFIATTPSNTRQQQLGIGKDTKTGGVIATPSSSLKTPSFLRRDNFSAMSTIGEDLETSPQVRRTLPFQKRKFGRSLSDFAKTMRMEQERAMDEKAEEELDLLREQEDEAAGIARPKTAPTKIIVQNNQLGDSHAGGGLDRDGFVPSDIEQEASEVEETELQVGKDGKPRKPWKKKGLKRQTRKHNMKPVAKQVQPQAGPDVDADASEDEEVVHETQGPNGDAPSDLEVGSDDVYSSAVTKTRPKAKASTKVKTASEKKLLTKRKVKPDAHANYRALKIKNKNSKAKGGRFGRGRR